MEKQTTRARLIDICIVKTTRKAIRRTARPYQFLHEPTLDKQASSCQSEEEEKATLTREQCGGAERLPEEPSALNVEGILDEANGAHHVAAQASFTDIHSYRLKGVWTVHP